MIILKFDLLHLFIYISVGSCISFFIFYSVDYNSLSLFGSLNYPKFASEKYFKLASVFFYMNVSIIF